MFNPKQTNCFSVMLALLSTAMLTGLGCGTTSNRLLTEQLVTSDAVDRAISEIDFRVLNGEKVYLDTQYIRTIKGIGFVNADYIVSSLRQQITAAGCFLQDSAATSDYIIEARVGALGTEGHQITYGVPASSALSSAASLVSPTASIPIIPEVALGKKNNTIGAAKIGVYAYHRETKQPVWQSGISQATSDAKDYWILGAGPFQRGEVYDGLMFAGSRLEIPLINEDGEVRESTIDYHAEHDFSNEKVGEVMLAEAQEEKEAPEKKKSEVKQAGYKEEVSARRDKSKDQPKPIKENQSKKES